MAVEQVSIHLIFPLVVGLIIGIVEAYFVYEDENMTSGRQFLGDMWHGLIFSVLGVLVATNVPYLMVNFIPENFHGFLMVDSQGISLVVCVLITIFMMLKMVASHSIRGVSGRGFREKFWHKAVIAIAIGFSPYYIFMLYEPLSFIQDAVPWLPF